MTAKSKIEFKTEGLTKEELEIEKLRSEILKNEFEIKEKGRTWASRNMAILIPSLIGLGTLLTGYFTGYFSVESKRLEIEKHDLQAEIKEFTEKKDSVNKKYYSLLSEKALLKTNLSRLKSDSISLSNTLKFIRDESLMLEDQKNLISDQLTTIKSERKKLILNNTKLAKDISLSPFMENIRLLNSDIRISEPYNQILEYLRKKDSNYDYYTKYIEKIIQESNNVSQRAIYSRILFQVTEDTFWFNKMLNISNDYCEQILNNSQEKLDAVKFWPIYTVNINYGSERSLNVFYFLSDKIDLLKSYDKEVECLLFSLSFIKNSYQKTYQYYDYNPDKFCKLLQVAKDLFSKQIKNDYVSYSLQSFYMNYVPLSYVCQASNFLANENSLSKRTKNTLTTYCMLMFDYSASLMDKPANISDYLSWKKWQEQYDEYIIAASNPTAYCRRVITSKLFGNM